METTVNQEILLLNLLTKEPLRMSEYFKELLEGKY